MKLWAMIAASVFIQYALAYIANNDACVEWIKASPYCFYPLFFHAAILNFAITSCAACEIQDTYFIKLQRDGSRIKNDRFGVWLISLAIVIVNFIAFFSKMYPISAEVMK